MSLIALTGSSDPGVLACPSYCLQEAVTRGYWGHCNMEDEPKVTVATVRGLSLIALTGGSDPGVLGPLQHDR